MYYKRALCSLVIPLILIGLLAAACGNTSPSTSSPTSTATPTNSSSPSPTAPPTTAPTATATTAASSGPVVKTATATVAGKVETILTDAQGKTLYYYKPDTATQVACTGSCVQNWPPLIFSGTGNPTGATSVTGTLGVLQGPNGAQVTYNGHPLYTYVGDSAPGQTNGQGKGDVWFVVTPDIATLS
jgi:predicted lipoprotein with Yx(FWY)xxD motif